MFLNIARVTVLPGTLAASTLYIVSDAVNADLTELVFTNNDGTAARHVFNKADATMMVNSAVSTALASFSSMQVVADIAARNTMGAAATQNFLVLVVDATADTSVASGAATYVYNHGTTTFTKISEFESMDVALTWSALQNKPTSSVAAIDSAVSASHSHTNKAVLDLLTDDGNGNLQYDGAYPQVPLSSAAW